MRAVIVLCTVVVLVACQPTGGPSAVPTPTGGDSAEDPLGAPAAGMPRSLDDLLGRGELLAEEWQDDPVLAEVEVVLDDGAWAGARLVYLAGDADRFLTLSTSSGGFTVQRPTLATLQAQPVTADGVAQIPEFPDDAAAPQELADAAATGDCAMGGASTVLYATGAPVAWDGTTWRAVPVWTATVAADDGTGAVLDPVSANVTGCL